MYPFEGISHLDHFDVVRKTVSAAFPELDKLPFLEARSTQYPTHHYLMRGLPESKQIASGKAVQTSLSVTLDGDYGGYVGTEDWTFNVSEGVEFLTTHWRKEKGTTSIHEDELDAEYSGGVFDMDSYTMSLMDIERDRKRRMIVDAAEKIENGFWAAPDPRMELANAAYPVRSIPYSVNEFTDGIAPNCTTQHGISRADVQAALGPDGRRLLQCDRREYLEAAADTTGKQHFVEVMQGAINQNRMTTIPLAEEYGHSEEVLAESFVGFFTDQAGIDFVSRTQRAHGNFFGMQGPNDLGRRDFQFAGIPFIYVPALDNAAIYPTYADGNAGSAQTAGDLITNRAAGGRRGGRYFAIRKDAVNHYYWRGRKMALKDWYPLQETNPEQFVAYIRSKRCLHFKRLKPHILIGPGKDFSDF